jgi:hypothetical protein
MLSLIAAVAPAAAQPAPVFSWAPPAEPGPESRIPGVASPQAEQIVLVCSGSAGTCQRRVPTERLF